MISREDVDNLADLARLELDEAQKMSLVKDLDSILGYFDQLKEAGKAGEEMSDGNVASNVMRADTGVGLLQTESLAEALVEAAPKHNGRYIRVKKIL